MAKISKNQSGISRSLRPQLIISFSLMSVIPILALLNLIFPSFFPRESLFLVVAVVLVLSALGFLLIKRIIDPIIKISSDVKVIASGELSRKIDIDRDDEIGELSIALNQMTQHIKNNMDELKIYGERTKDINLQINKQVISLSGLLEIGNLITKGADIKEIFDIVVSRLVQVGQSTAVFVVYKNKKKFETKVSFGLKPAILSAMSLSANAYLLNRLLSVKPFFKVEKNTPTDASSELLKLLNFSSVLVFPIVVQNEPSGLLGIGNQAENFTYSSDDIEVVNIFAKQLGIAIENDFLTQKVQDLEIKDVRTGLYNRRYIFDRLQEEILRAISYQQPCAFIAIKIENLPDIELQYGEWEAEEVLVKVGEALKSSVTAIDRVGYIDRGVFGVVVHKKNKKQAQHLAEQIRSEIGKFFYKQDEAKVPHVVLAVVENPIDGADSASLMDKAETILKGEGKKNSEK